MFDDIVEAALEWMGLNGYDDLPDAVWEQGEGMGINGGGSGCIHGGGSGG